MPALPAAPSVIRIQFEYVTVGSLRAGNRIYFRYSGGPPSPANLNTLSTDVSTAFGTDLASLMVVGYALTDVVCTDLTSDTSAEGSWSGSVEGTRSGSGGDASVNDAVNHAFQIARRYRGGKPKTFWPFGVASDYVNPATWDNAFVAAVAAGWTSFEAALLALTGIGCTLTAHVNVSYYSGFAVSTNPVTGRARNIPTPRVGDAVVDTITGNVVKAEIGSQRRRRASTSA